MTVKIALIGLAAALVVACAGTTPATPATTATSSPTVTPAPTQTQKAATPSPVIPTASAAASATAAASAPAAASLDPSVIASIDVGNGPCAMVELDGSVWVTNYSDGTLVRIDGTTDSIAQKVDLGLGSMPCGVTAANGKLWVGALGKNALLEVDPGSAAIVKSIDVGGPTWDVQFGFGSVWAAIQGPDKILRIDPADGSLVATIDGGPTVSGLAVTDTEVWVANQGGSTIDRIDSAKNNVSGHIELPAAPFWFAVGAGKVLASLTQDDSVVVIDAKTGKPTSPISVGERPHDPGFVGDSFWMPNQLSGDVSVVDPATGTLEGSFSPPNADGVFLADQALGDGWILDYAGTTAFRLKPDSGKP